MYMKSTTTQEPTMTATTTPREIDEQIAAKYKELQAINAKRDLYRAHIIHRSRPDFYYRGRRRVTDRTYSEARTILEQQIPAELAREAAARAMSRDSFTTDETRRTFYRNNPEILQSPDQAQRLLDTFDQLTEERENLRAEFDALESQYTGWSRFFLVTSSVGHIHSSLHCSTCRPTTEFAWMPNLSDKDEATAVAECGPALCTVCFPTAPLDWTASKITKRAAAELAS